MGCVRVGGVRVWGGHGGCKRRIEAFVKIQKKIGGSGGSGRQGSGSGVRVDVNEDLQFLRKFTKKKFEGGSGGGLGGGGRVGWGGVRVNVNAMLGVGGDVGYGRCEPRIEGIVQY